MVVGGIVLLVIGFVGEEGLPPLGAREIGLILGIAIVGGAIPFALFYLALARAPATQVFTWFFLIRWSGPQERVAAAREQPTLRLVVGLAAVSVGLWLVLATRAPQEELLVDSTPPL